MADGGQGSSDTHYRRGVGDDQENEKQRQIIIGLSKFMSSNEDLDFSFLPLNHDCHELIKNELIERKKTRILKLRSCLQPGLLHQLRRQFNEPLNKTVTVAHVDVSANTGLNSKDAGSLGILLRTWGAKHLDLSECCLKSQDIERLCKSCEGYEIKTLVYNNNTVEAAEMEAICKFVTSSKVHQLHLGNCYLNDKLLSRVEEDHYWKKLDSLGLSYNRNISSEGYQLLGRVVRESSIMSIRLADCDMTRDDIFSFQRGLGGKQVDSLDLSYNDNILRPMNHELEPPKNIKKTDNIKTTDLGLAGCNLNGDTLKEMLQSTFEGEISSLNIRDNPELGQDLDTVAGFLTRLKISKLDISNCGLTKTEEDNFIMMFPRVEIQTD